MTTTTTPTTTTTQRPCPGGIPIFTETYYQTALASWPREGTLLHLGLEAATSENELLVYELVSPPSFIYLDNNRDIRFNTDVSDGAFVGILFCIFCNDSFLPVNFNNIVVFV
jgi:hypothetical protein